MRYSFGLLALASLAVSTPLVKRQDIDFDAYNDIPTASAVGAPIGVTAVQATTAAYNPSAAASAAANAAATIDDSSAATSTADAATPTDGLKKRDTPVGTVSSGCTVLAAAGNAPSTTPDSPSAFAANTVYSNAALNAHTPNGYVAVAVNKNASAEDPSYLTYTTKGMTSYNPSVCAGYCTALAGCSSFNIYYERDPAYTTNSGCTNPPSTVWLKCALYGAPLTAASATNFGQFRQKFQTAIAGANTYTISSPDAIPGFQGPVGLKKAITNDAYNFLFSQSFPTTQPYDPSVCAAACLAKTQSNKAAQNSTGIYDTCRFFDAYVLYKNGAGGVFTCNYYSLASDPSAATNTGQTDAKGNVYTIGFSFSYTLNPEYDTPGTGLTYYQYDEPYNYYTDLNNGYVYPTLAPFQSSNYISTGLMQNPAVINYGWDGLHQIPGQPAFTTPIERIALVFKGYFIAPAAGTYTFTTPNGIDDEWYMYHGDKALSGWNKDNYDAHTTYASGDSSYSITLKQGYILPVLFLWANTAGPGAIYFQVTLPDTTTKTDVTGLFTPVNAANDAFSFSAQGN